MRVKSAFVVMLILFPAIGLAFDTVDILVRFNPAVNRLTYNAGSLKYELSDKTIHDVACGNFAGFCSADDRFKAFNGSSDPLHMRYVFVSDVSALLAELASDPQILSAYKMDLCPTIGEDVATEYPNSTREMFCWQPHLSHRRSSDVTHDGDYCGGSSGFSVGSPLM